MLDLNVSIHITRRWRSVKTSSLDPLDWVKAVRSEYLCQLLKNQYEFQP